jgi:hypothetical protein
MDWGCRTSSGLGDGIAGLSAYQRELVTGVTAAVLAAFVIGVLTLIFKFIHNRIVVKQPPTAILTRALAS